MSSFAHDEPRQYTAIKEKYWYEFLQFMHSYSDLVGMFNQYPTLEDAFWYWYMDNKMEGK